MITKHKSRIALATCLLLAQGTPMIHAGVGPEMFHPITKPFEAIRDFFKPKNFFIQAPIGLGGLIGIYLVIDAITDVTKKIVWNDIQEKRKKSVENALKSAQDYELKNKVGQEFTENNAQERAQELFPGNFEPTPIKKRVIKALGGITLCGVCAYLANRLK
ncbi:MAG: hypothetical protein ACHQVS_02575 [Candidatus Babeliales bacterium]